jgi:hypothetical protein
MEAEASEGSSVTPAVMRSSSRERRGIVIGRVMVNPTAFRTGEIKVKRILICLVFMLSCVGVANAQTKTMTGTVIDNPRGMYKWAAIVIKVGDKKYFVYTESGDLPTPKTSGVIDEVGRRVRVFYTKAVNSPGYDGELRATKIIEIKKTRPWRPS